VKPLREFRPADFAQAPTWSSVAAGRIQAIDDMVANLVVNYELSGRLTLRVITEESITPAVRDVLAVDHWSMLSPHR
jgi:hypothetical protein